MSATLRQKGTRTFWFNGIQSRGVGQDGEVRTEDEPHISQVCGDLDALVPGPQCHWLAPHHLESKSWSVKHQILSTFLSFLPPSLKDFL